jgi:hypothetical protein
VTKSDLSLARELDTVRPDDARYAEMVVGYNRRFTASPEAVHVVRTTGEAVAAVTEAVRSGRRLSVRSGGHCYADLVHHPQAEVIIDLSTMNRVDYDAGRRAFMIEPGARLGPIYDTLYRRWGVTLPGGTCPLVGIGGHACGGGYGFLTRRDGLASDHIHAVEMVVADADGSVRAVTASRDSTGDLHDLWWATTGGGGGSFGVVTRFWFRSAGAVGSRPQDQLPRPPCRMLLGVGELPWDRVDEPALTGLLRRFGQWCMRHSTAEPPYGPLLGFVILPHRSGGTIQVMGLVDGTLPRAREVLDEYLATTLAGTGASPPSVRGMTWTDTLHWQGISDIAATTGESLRLAVKTAYMRDLLTPGQCATMYRSLTREDYAHPRAAVWLSAQAGRVAEVPQDATAYAHRDAPYFLIAETPWSTDADADADEEEAAHLAWQRELYRDLFADTGGYPVPNDRTDGCYVNLPDPDILDPGHNASGVPWHAFYWKDNYPRLQRTKQRWDPADVFRHSHSVRLP